MVNQINAPQERINFSSTAIKTAFPDFLERIYVRGDKNINYGRVLEVMGTLSGAGFSKVALISEPYKN